MKRFSQGGDFSHVQMAPNLPVHLMTDEFRSGMVHGLRLAAQVARAHIIQLANRHGRDSSQVKAVELDLYCLDRGLRKFGLTPTTAAATAP